MTAKLTRAALSRLRKEIAARGPDAIAVCLLHAVQDDQHEAAVRDALKPLDVPVHVSSEVCADPREFERMTTVLLDAYVSPVLRGYMGTLLSRITGVCFSNYSAPMACRTGGHPDRASCPRIRR